VIHFEILAAGIHPAISHQVEKGNVMLRWILAFAMAAAACGHAAAQSAVERGSYLVNTIMTCANCHSPKGPPAAVAGKDYSGGLRFNEPPFDVTAPNITPDKETGIGAWSDAELKKFLATGIKPDGVKAAPIMPYEFYTVLTARDLDALVAYLKSVPPVRREMPLPEYRRASKPETPTYTGAPMTDADMTDKLSRGRYLLSISHCLECHTPEGPSAEHDFAGSTGKGGRTFKGPWGESKSVNITSHPVSGLGQWSDDEIKRAIPQGIARDGRKLKPPMAYPAYATMTAQDLDAVVAFVRTIPPLE